MEHNFEYILFVTEDDLNSQRVMPLVNSDTDKIKVVSKVNKPQWLNGVPTLLHIATEDIYEGSKCLMFMLKRKETNTSPIKQEPTKITPIAITSSEEEVDGVHFVDEVD